MRGQKNGRMDASGIRINDARNRLQEAQATLDRVNNLMDAMEFAHDFLAENDNEREVLAEICVRYLEQARVALRE